MAWNPPGNKGKNNDAWDDEKPPRQSGNQSSQRPQGLPDLEQALRRLSALLGFSSKQKRNSEDDPQSPMDGKRLLGLAIVAALVVWAGCGFYTIREAERGVVTRFGKFSHLVEPGLNWRPPLIDRVRAVNVEAVRELATSGVMLSADENVVRVEMNVQYRVTDPEKYLYSVTNADDSLRQATDSALRGVIGRSSMDRVLTEGRTLVRSETQREIEQTIQPYQMGITLLDVNFQAARPPEEVKAAFDDAIAARENREQYVREAEAYANEVQPRANGKAQRILEEARAYKERVVLEAQGEVARFAKLLPEYKAAPAITKERLYIESMERVLSRTRKVLVNDKGNNILMLPLDQARNAAAGATPVPPSALLKTPVQSQASDRQHDNSSPNIIEQRRLNSLRNDTQRQGAE